ncbi:MAG: zinc ribbon domain-containing protein [Eubacteriales bacterium]|nr:zinc ribbon domain-containing protein [Eubacteriales bacterium]
MICNECGSYNAETLTKCKVCGAVLKTDDANGETVDPQSALDDGRPSRDFVKAPSWPTRAYSGAPEKAPVASSEAPASSGAFRPTIPPRAASSAPAVYCPHCGKPALSEAPFCAYCGQRLDAGAAPAPARPAAKASVPAPQQSRRPAPQDDYDDEDGEYDDEEEDDYKPQKPAKRGGKIARREEQGEEMEEYDDEYEEEDYEDDMPRKRGKGTTFLFWGLIVLLLALIVVFGMYIAKKNFDGSVGKMFASIGGIFNKDANSDVNAADPSATDDAAASEMYTAAISEYTDPSTGEVSFDVDIHAPTGSTIRIITDATLKNDTATVAANDRIILRIARDVFMPNAPVDNEVITITPNIQAISPDGQTMQVTVPDVTVTVPTLSMTVSEPAGDTVNATFDNSPIAIMGQVNNYDGEIAVFINNEQVYVDSTGLFTASYTPKQTVSAQPTATPVTDATAATSADPSVTPDPSASPSTSPSTSPDATAEGTDEVSEETAAAEAIDTASTAGTTGETETITIEARKNNCVTARKVITVEPYVMQTMAMVVTNDLKGLSSAEGSVTVTGTITPGAAITATSASTDVTFGAPTVSDTGTFSMAVTIAKVGAFDITLTGKMIGYYDGTATVTVERPPSASSSSFKKAAGDITKSFDKIVAGTVTSGDFVVTGRITEIIATDPYTIFRVQVSDGVEVVVANRSAKSTINSSDLKEKKQVAGTLKGLYSDGKSPYLWGWFIWNK